MKAIVPSIIILCIGLNGCALIPFFARDRVVENAENNPLTFAKNIPASKANCPQIKQSKINNSELMERAKIEEESRIYFINEDFKNLNSRYELYQQRGSRTASGLWKLTFFYIGLVALPETYFSNDDQWNKTKEKIQKWIAAYPKSPAPYIAHSKLLQARSWYLRNSSHKSFSSFIWDSPEKNIDAAKQILEVNKTISSRDPEWYTAMIEIARTQSWKIREVKTLFNEAVLNEPYYYPHYFLVAEYLDSSWNESPKVVEAFVDDAVRITRKCEKDRMYARIYWSKINNNPRAFLMEDVALNHISWGSLKNVKWDKMRSGFDSVTEKYPDLWNANHYAKFSCLARDKAVIKKTFLKLQPRKINNLTWEYLIDDSAWENFIAVGSDECKTWALK
jgi:hypothetical protein